MEVEYFSSKFVIFSKPNSIDLNFISMLQRVSVSNDEPFIKNLHYRILTKLQENSLPTVVKQDDKIYPIASYYFDGQGKSIRPQIVLAVAKALTGSEQICDDVMTVAMIAEMIHTGSLIHDDVIDKSDKR